MGKDQEPKRFFVRGGLPRLQRVPVGLLSADVIISEAERLGPEIARRQENERLLAEDIATKTAHVASDLLAIANSRYSGGEFETVRRLTGERWSFWEDRSDGYHNFSLFFRAKRKKVSEVQSFDMLRGGDAVEIKFKDKELAEVSCRFDQAKLLEHKNDGTATAWELWVDRTVFGGVAPENADNFLILSDLTFAVDPSGLRLKRDFYIRPSRADSGNDQEPSPVPEKSIIEWKFNPKFNRFAEKYESHLKTREEYEEEGFRLAGGNQAAEALVRESASRTSFHSYPILSPTEFTQGLELLLETVPLEPV